MNLKDKITIIIVIYDNEYNFLKNLNNIKNFRTIIVDNLGNNLILKKIKKFKNIQIISNKQNIGFGKAVNKAFKIVNTKYVLLLNPDSSINIKNINKLASTLDENKNCIIAVPQIYKNNLYKTEDRLFPENEMLPRNNFEKKIKENLFKTIPSGDVCIEFFLGAIMLIKKNYFKNRIFDERYFLYFEDTQLCKNLRSDKKSIILVNKSYANHEQHASVKKTIKNLFIINFNLVLSKNIYFKTKILSYLFIKDIFIFFIKIIINLLLLRKNKFIINFGKFFGILFFIYKNST
jgi:N-acetylglucosaminyl-diphospho-decaprenol L-rhamnosyltransferase